MFQDFKCLVVEYFVFNSHMYFPLNTQTLRPEGKGEISLNKTKGV